MPADPTPASPAAEPPPTQREFLVVVDDTPEMRVALRYACRRAKRTDGRVALLYVIDTIEPQQWAAVADLMRQEAHEAAEEVLHRFSALALSLTGRLPRTIIREGSRRDELLKVLAEDKAVSVLVLGAGTGAEGPGPLISTMVGKYCGTLRVALMIVPGALSDEEIDAIS